MIGRFKRSDTPNNTNTMLATVAKFNGSLTSNAGLSTVTINVEELANPTWVTAK